ncbi:hypothetical protein AB1Y20_008031 [Prymnesium parvum]|uniref:N-acetyltransferase domain-containing protein n=1 Tax=Prymnesium parvum TaxID=97485 RepID=A0AB34ITT8_PRYPA
MTPLALAHLHQQVLEFATIICGDATRITKEQIVELEAANMESHPRNGDPFEAYLSRMDLLVHTAMTSEGELVGFAISCNEGRGKVYVYELHVTAAHRRRGIARALLELCEQSSTSRGRNSPLLELQVHTANSAAQGFYTHMGFVHMRQICNGSVCVMQRKR